MTRINAARQLYFKHSGRSHRLIEREMHALGFTTFSRRRLYNYRTSAGKLRLGWIQRFGWKNELSEPGAVATGSNPQSEIQDPKFDEWLPNISPSMRWDWPYQQLIYEKLRAVTDGTSKRLMIFLPPRHGKSELVTVRYTAWRLKVDPSLNVILGSYNQRLANRFSRKVRCTWEDDLAGSLEARTQPPAARTEPASSPPYKGGVAAASADGVVLSVPENSSRRLGVSAVQTTSRRRLNTVAEWETGLGGGLRAVGVGAGITGFGAGLVIIDDPVKSRAEAESKTYREKLWEWYRDDLYTRLEPGASIILIQTRWHEDDLAGRLLKEMNDGGEHWDVISLPALAESSASSPPYESGVPAGASPRGVDVGEVDAELPSLSPLRAYRNTGGSVTPERGWRKAGVVPDGVVPDAVVLATDPLNRKEGDALCPDRFNRDDLLRIKRSLGSYSFSALYQQRPVPPEGGLFKRAWFSRIVDRAPDNIRWCRGYDLALSTNTSADFTASFRCGLDLSMGDLYIADGFRKRIEFPDQRRYILRRILEENDTGHGIEQALHGLAFIQEFRREHRLVSRVFRAVKVVGDKFTRALSWANRAEEGKVVLVRGPWIDEFLEEVTSFPTGAHDDQIDAVSIAVQMLEHRRHTAHSF